MKTPKESILAELSEQVKVALRQWHADANTRSPLASLQIFQQLLQKEMIGEHEATNRILYQGLQLLKEQHPRDEYILRRSALDRQLNDLIAVELNIASSTLFRYKDKAILRLAEVLWKWEQSNQDSYQSRLLARLAPPSNHHLFGVDVHVQKLMELLTKEGEPWIVSVAGMGGIGKTTWPMLWRAR